MSIKRILSVAALVLLFVAAFAGWRLLGPATAFDGDRYYLYIRTGSNFEQVVAQLEKDTVLKSPAAFRWIAERRDYPENVKAGKYEIRKDISLVDLIRMLRNGRQTPVHLVITKLRTRETLASWIGRKFECDSASAMHFFESKDSLAVYGLDTNTLMAAVMPNTYSYFWNTTPSAIFKKMYAAYKAWWTPTRLQEAQQQGLTPITACILASIVEEETNAQSDKGKIASVYMNRLARGMRLAADPTIKFALQDFELKRIYDKQLKVESPYNTYLHPGLPPGPICTPSPQTLDAVLTAPKTDYLFFVAKPDFSGYSNFAVTFKEHMENAKAYQKALDEEMAKKAAAQKAAK
ncbi:MAG: endolytic transglycosylase MltG [Bacteroidota bacterium]|nr:endolytic transglycosylase MltG [Bacteroidota bacterium]MDP4214908.1 endolytic transglycosylase MltG [Bacteroidota bacterium]MDP4246359.1 endolytic transglycosylase MltG [Bacteroidota bacterium]MDP4254368.1 endolytic transglycosylase MltG [Bacteroidota bacterium]MDP4258835.1 endolytic transglycosylase MltG [Bacteroidota bacterium]